MGAIITETDKSVKLANQSATNVIGQTKVKMEFGPERFNATLIVIEDLTRDMLIGNDILNKAEITKPAMSMLKQAIKDISETAQERMCIGPELDEEKLRDINLIEELKLKCQVQIDQSAPEIIAKNKEEQLERTNMEDEPNEHDQTANKNGYKHKIIRAQTRQTTKKLRINHYRTSHILRIVQDYFRGRLKRKPKTRTTNTETATNLLLLHFIYSY